MDDALRKYETASRLMCYSAAAGLGAFAFGQTATDALGAIVYTGLGGLVLERGESYVQDLDGDGYNDFMLMNTHAAGIGGIGSVQFRGSAHPGWYGTPGSSIDYPNAGASYVQVNMDAPSTGGTNAYYVRSFNDDDIIGPSNPQSWDMTPGSGGDLYGLLSQYPGFDQNSFWNPSDTYPDVNEYAGLRIVDTNGDERWAWVRFQVTIHDVADEYGFPFPDGIVDWHDLPSDWDRTVTLFDYAIEMTPDTDIVPPICPGPGVCGDLNCDGFTGIDDLNIVLRNWNAGTPPMDMRADPTGDDYVGIDDLNIVLGCWNQGTPPVPSLLAPVPEPGALGLLAAGAGALSLRRNGKRPDAYTI